MKKNPKEQQLDPCGCCEAEVPPVNEHENRPGQPELNYRIGTHASFLRRMLARLPNQPVPDGPNEGARPLTSLTARSPDDPAIALLDAWATAADVLTFYQERIANEGYLRTATERRSVLELARAIGYELNPGVAANTYLAFTVEDAPGAPQVVKVPKGTQVQNIPTPPALPQTFETSEEIEARAEWNELKPQSKEPQIIGANTEELYFEGINTGLQPGDGIVLIGKYRREDPNNNRWAFRIVHSVELFPEEGYTRIALDKSLGQTTQPVDSNDDPLVYAFRQRAALCEPSSCTTGSKAAVAVQHVSNGSCEIILDAVYPKILSKSWIVLQAPGNNASETKDELFQVNVVSTASCNKAINTNPVNVQVTKITLDKSVSTADSNKLETVVVFAQSEELTLTQRPRCRPVRGNEIVFNRQITDFSKDRPLVVSGKLMDWTPIFYKKLTNELACVTGREYALPEYAPKKNLTIGQPQSHRTYHTMRPSVKSAVIIANLLKKELEARRCPWTPAAEDAETVSEVVFADSVSHDNGQTTIRLKEHLKNNYDPATVTIYGNVAAATHGETVNEILGSGDGARANQEFKLRKPPLTYVSAKNPKGTDSTLEVRVNGLLWKEVSSFYGLEPQSESYIIRHEDDGTAHIIFGDGENGARLSTGIENVTATYRSGIGFDGQLDADSLTLLKTRAFGIREVTNPLPTSGADAPEKLADARINAPRTVLTFDSIVSLKDFEDFARGFAGIGKAQAVSLWNGQANVVHITVASASGDPIGPGTKTYDDLLAAIKDSCEPTQTFHVGDCIRLFFCVDASIRIDYPRFEKEEVRNRVEGVLYKAFSFEQRSLGQPITAAEIITVIHGVPGVVAVDLNKLYENTDPSGPEQTTAPPVLPADRTMMATWDRQFYPAQLLMLKPDGLTLKEME